MDFKQLVDYLINSIAQPIVGLLFGAAVVYFVWNIFQFIRKGDNPDALAELRQKVVWGIIALAVIVSVWGLVNFLRSSLNLNENPISIPTYQVNG